VDWELSTVELLSPVAVGAPGKRTFFLVIADQRRWFRVWLEKQDLQALAMAVRQLVIKLSLDATPSSVQREEPSHETSRLPAAELELREANLGFQDGHGVLAFTVDVVGPRGEGQSSLRFYPTLLQLRQFAARAEEVCAAGRPICPLCGQPIDPSGHDCPGEN
jgi:uncharacterized repeat protein (TIGR03847 family)